MTDELEMLRLRGRGILSDALMRPVEGGHGGNEAARQKAIGQSFSSILAAWDRLMADVATMVKTQAPPKPVATTPAVIPMQTTTRTNR